MTVPTAPPAAVRSAGSQTSTASRTPSPAGTYTDWRRRDTSIITSPILARTRRLWRARGGRDGPDRPRLRQRGQQVVLEPVPGHLAAVVGVHAVRLDPGDRVAGRLVLEGKAVGHRGDAVV